MMMKSEYSEGEEEGERWKQAQGERWKQAQRERKSRQLRNAAALI
jgi:hypothetical protein